MNTLPDCVIQTNKFCDAHLDQEIQQLFADGARAVTVYDGQVLHVNGLQLLAETPHVYMGPCQMGEDHDLQDASKV